MKNDPRLRLILLKLLDNSPFIAAIFLAFLLLPPLSAVITLIMSVVVGSIATRLLYVFYTKHQLKLIDRQSNAVQRHYITQRLRALEGYFTDEQHPAELGRYILKDPQVDDSVLLICRAKPNRWLDERFYVQFMKRKFVSADDSGNRYRITVSSYTLAPDIADIHYEMQSAVYNSENELQTQDIVAIVKKNLPQMPDEVLDRIEHALAAWEPVTVDD